MKFAARLLLHTFLFEAVFLIANSLPSVLAQSDSTARWGILAHAGINLHSADFRELPGIPNCCPRFEQGDGIGFGLSGLWEIPVSSQNYFSARLGFQQYSGVLSKTENTTVIVDGISTNGGFTHTLRSNLDALTASVLFGSRWWNRLSVFIGPQAGFLFTRTYSQQEQVTMPTDRGTFVDINGNDTQSRIRNASEGEIPSVRMFRIAAVGGISYDLPMNKRANWTIGPELSYEIGLSPIVQNLTWNVSAFRAGIAIKHAFLPDVAKKILRDTTIVRDTTIITSVDFIAEKLILASQEYRESMFEEDDETVFANAIVTEHYVREMPEPKKTSSLKVSIAAKGVENDGRETVVAQMRIEEFVSDKIHPLLPYVFFDENSDKLRERYIRKDKESAANFSEKLLQSASTLEVYWNLLNIVGLRMLNIPDATLRIVGCNSDEGLEKNNLSLSMKRSETIKQYLTEVWGIAPNRLQLEQRRLPELHSNKNSPEGIQENRRAELYSSHPDILDIVTANDTIRSVSPPALRFYPKAQSSEGIAVWKITASQNNVVLKTYSGSDIPPSSLTWNVEKEQHSVPRFDAPLEYAIEAQDKIGSGASSSSALPLEMITIRKKRQQSSDDVQRDKYNLILFDFNSAKLGPANQRIVNLIRQRLKRNSKIVATGYTDRTGDDGKNKELATARAKNAITGFKEYNASAVGKGEESLLYDNDMPEGRMYCRTVEIEVETPIEKGE